MKRLNYIYHTLAVMIIMMITSCEDSLDQLPVTSKSSSSFFSTENEIESAVTGTYAVLQDNGLYGLYLVALGDVLADDAWEEVANNDEGIYGQLDLFTQTPTNGLLDAVWTKSYLAIQRANTVLQRIDPIEFSDVSVKDSRKGECHFIRALMYFNLVRIFGDVPLVTKETEDPSEFFGQTRTPVAEVYGQIISDLQNAVSSLPVKQDQKGRVTKGAAQALLGKVYLTLGELDNAKTKFSEVISSSEYSLMPNVEDIFSLDNEGNSEVIFAVQFSSGVNEGSSAFQQFSPAGREGVSGGKGHNLPERTIYNAYLPNDDRLGAYVDVTDAGVPYSTKLKQNEGGAVSDGGSDMVVIRLADIVLLLAEIELMQNNLSEGAELLNQVRNRAGLSNTTETTQEGLLQALDLERRLELVNEGHRWFDLLRRGNAIEVMNNFFQSEGRNIQISEKDLLMPIPQSQINADPAITQNEGY